MYRKIFFRRGTDTPFKTLDKLLMWVCQQTWNDKSMSATITKVYVSEVKESNTVIKISLPYYMEELGYITASCFIDVADLQTLNVTDTDVWDMLDNSLNYAIIDRLCISSAFMNTPEDID